MFAWFTKKVRRLFLGAIMGGMLLCSVPVKAQELNARVEILSPQLPHTNKRVLEVLQQVVSDFLNKRSWTGQSVQAHERIDCSLVITISAWDGSSEFSAQAQIMATRPVYQTSYASPMLNIYDKEFNFSYIEGQSIDFSDQQFTHNLTSLLAYYAYLIIGMDADSFEHLSGERYFRAAQQVVSQAQGSSYPGWRAMGGEGIRYWLVQNLIDRRYQIFRDFIYNFSRKGLDQLADKAESARQQIFEAVMSLESVERFGQSSVLDQVFFSTKSSELVGVLGGFPQQERIQAYNILSKIDPANENKYEALRKL